MRYFTTLPISLFFFTAMLNFTSGCSKNLSQMELSLDHPANHNATQTQYLASINTLTSSHDENIEDTAIITAVFSEERQDDISVMLNAYFDIGDQLAKDRLGDLNEQAQTIIETFHHLEEETPSDAPHFWHIHQLIAETIHDQAHELAELSDIKAARIAYGILSDAWIHFLQVTGIPTHYEKPVHGFVCGMAKDMPEQGIWLQDDQENRNPYFGTSMLMCHREKFNMAVTPSSEVGEMRKDTHGKEHITNQHPPGHHDGGHSSGESKAGAEQQKHQHN